jgi:hypothetical protein
MRSLDDIIRELRDTADAAWFIGNGNTYTLLMDARSKLLEARRIADDIMDHADEDEQTFECCMGVANRASNFLAGAVHHE